ncbi:spexin isoform 1-T1 [Trichechus inunguis]
MKGLRSLAATTLALFLVLSSMGNSNSAPQRLLERRNWTPQAMLYLKGAQQMKTPGCLGTITLAEGRRFIYDQGRRKDLSDRPPLERHSPESQPITLPEAAALLLASFQKPQEAEEENFDQTRFLEDSLPNW